MRDERAFRALESAMSGRPARTSEPPFWTSTKDHLRDLVTERGHFVDEPRGVMIRVEPPFRKEYDAERLVAVFPRLDECVKPAVDAGQLEACVRAGMVTEAELERAGVLTRSLHSRALIVKPLGQRPAGVAKR